MWTYVATLEVHLQVPWNGQQFCGSIHNAEVGVVLAIGEETNFAK